MFICRSNEINSIISSLGKTSDEPGFARVIFVSGCFGSGKSALIDELEKILTQSNMFDCLLKCRNYQDLAFIPDYTYQLVTNPVFLDNNDKFEACETEYVHLKYIENLIKIKETDFDSFNNILKKVILKSVADTVLESYYAGKADALGDVTSYNSYLEKNSDKLLMNSIEVFAAEALIVDLMNHFFPLSPDKPSFEHYLGTKIPKRILIETDDSDPVAGTLVKWLFGTFIHYCTNKSFNEFISFDFEGSKLNTKVSDFLDFRFIFASRHEFIVDNTFSEISNFSNEIENIKLDRFNLDQIEEMINSNGLKGKINPELAMDITLGIPSVIQLWIDSRSYAANNFNDFLLPLVVEKIFRFSAAYEIEWLKKAVFLDVIDKESLKCFDIFEGAIGKALNYFSRMNEMAFKNEENLLAVYPEIKQYILKFIENESSGLYNELKEIAAIAAVQRELLLPLGNREKKLINQLACFYKFDKDFVPEYSFGTQSGEIKNLIRDFAYFFEDSGYYTAFKPEVYTQLKKYNEIADKQNWELNQQKVKKCWDDFKDFLATRNSEIHESLKTIEIEKDKEEELLKLQRNEYTENRVKFMREENELIELKVTIADYSINKNLYSSVSFFSIAIIMGVAGYFITDIFESSTNIESFEIIQYILFAFACVFGTIGSVYGIKMMVSSSRAEYERLNGIYSEKLKRKEERQEVILDISGQIENTEKNIKLLKDSSNELQSELKINSEKMKVLFYFD